MKTKLLCAISLDLKPSLGKVVTFLDDPKLVFGCLLGDGAIREPARNVNMQLQVVRRELAEKNVHRCRLHVDRAINVCILFEVLNY